MLKMLWQNLWQAAAPESERIAALERENDILRRDNSRLRMSVDRRDEAIDSLVDERQHLRNLEAKAAP